MADGDFEALRSAVQSSFCFWGGRFNPILPVDRPDLANALANLFRIDALHKTSLGEATDRFVDVQRKVRSPLVIGELFSRRWQDNWAANFVDISHPIGQMYDQVHHNSPNPSPSVDLYEWHDADPLADMFLLTYGRTLGPELAGLDYHGIMRLHLLAETKRIEDGGELPPLNILRKTVSALGRTNLREWGGNEPWHEPGFYVGSATDFDDLITFWNLRACGLSIAFFDPDRSKRFSTFNEHWKGGLGLLTPGADRNCAFWHRGGKGIGRPIDFEGRPLNCRVDDPLWNGLNLRPIKVTFGEANALGSLSRQYERTSLTFALPPRPFSDETRARHQQYVLSIQPGIGLYDSEQETLHTPDLPALNRFYARECLVGAASAARVEEDGLGALISVSRDDQTWRSLPTQKLLVQIFQLVGISAEPSTAGKVGTTLIRQMGKLSACRVFKIPGVRKLIEDHGPEQSFSRSTAKQIIRAHGTPGTLDNFQDLYIEYREPGVALSNDRVLEYLLDRQVFRPGLKFRCSGCQLDFWVSLDDARTHLDCEYCGAANNTARQLHDKDWAFRRSGLFGRNDHQGGAIPTVLTLLALNTIVSIDGAIHSMAMELRWDGAHLAPCETDFVFMPLRGRDGRQQIAIGECKTRGQIESADVTNLLAVAKAFPSEQFDVFLVFAKLGNFSKDELRLIASVNEDWRKRAIILAQSDLEQSSPYQASQRIMISLHDMAEATSDIFLSQVNS